jgi:hypothetical protein
MTFVKADMPNSSTIYPSHKNTQKHRNFKYFNKFDLIMDIQFWIYIIIIVITLIARSSKKKPTSFDPDADVDNRPQNKPISFEDLLREIQSAKTPAKPVEVPSSYKPVQAEKNYESDYEDYDDNLEEEVTQKPVVYDTHQDDVIYNTYEKAKMAAFERPSLEESMKVEDTKVTFGQFKEYNSRVQQSSVASQLRKELANKQSFKRAFILSEVLNRKF